MDLKSVGVTIPNCSWKVIKNHQDLDPGMLTSMEIDRFWRRALKIWYYHHYHAIYLELPCYIPWITMNYHAIYHLTMCCRWFAMNYHDLPHWLLRDKIKHPWLLRDFTNSNWDKTLVSVCPKIPHCDETDCPPSCTGYFYIPTLCLDTPIVNPHRPSKSSFFWGIVDVSPINQWMSGLALS